MEQKEKQEDDVCSMMEARFIKIRIFPCFVSMFTNRDDRKTLYEIGIDDNDMHSIVCLDRHTYTIEEFCKWVDSHNRGNPDYSIWESILSTLEFPIKDVCYKGLEIINIDEKKQIYIGAVHNYIKTTLGMPVPISIEKG